MKYNIEINQLVLSKTNLDLLDAAILNWLLVFCNSKNNKIESKRIDGMTWIDYGQLINDMPLLRIKSKGAITPRIKRIRDAGFIETEIKNSQKMYVSLTEKTDSLFIVDKSVENYGAVHETKRSRSRNRTGAVHETKPTIILTNHNTKTIDDTKVSKIATLVRKTAESMKS